MCALLPPPRHPCSACVVRLGGDSPAGWRMYGAASGAEQRPSELLDVWEPSWSGGQKAHRWASADRITRFTEWRAAAEEMWGGPIAWPWTLMPLSEVAGAASGYVWEARMPVERGGGRHLGFGEFSGFGGKSRSPEVRFLAPTRSGSAVAGSVSARDADAPKCRVKLCNEAGLWGRNGHRKARTWTKLGAAKPTKKIPRRPGRFRELPHSASARCTSFSAEASVRVHTQAQTSALGLHRPKHSPVNALAGACGSSCARRTPFSAGIDTNLVRRGDVAATLSIVEAVSNKIGRKSPSGDDVHRCRANLVYLGTISGRSPTSFAWTLPNLLRFGAFDMLDQSFLLVELESTLSGRL